MDHNELNKGPNRDIPLGENTSSEQLTTMMGENLSNDKNESIGNFQNIGNKAMGTPELPSTEQDSRELGKIIDTPQNSSITAIQPSSETIAKNLFSEELIETKSSLGKDGIKEVEKAIENFEKDGDAANFYDTARKMMEVNLDNSYNRKIGGGSAA